MELQLFISALLQNAVFALLPLIWWLLSVRGEVSFWRWLGLKGIKEPRKNKIILWILAGSLIFLLLSVFILQLTKGLATATSRFSGLGFRALLGILIYSLLQTSLPEELFFRGFLLKRLMGRLPFGLANALQALLFGLIHGIMFFSVAGVLVSLLIIAFTGGLAAYMGFVNEQKAAGSILPSWAMHAAANVFSGICSAFLLI